MEKIAVQIEKSILIFKTYKKPIEEENLNNTNIINTKKMIFSSEYINENIDLVGSFLKLIVLKNGITEARIDNISISSFVLPLIELITPIKKIVFKEDASLNYDVVEILLKNVNVEVIDCYYMPEFLFQELTKYNNRIVELRNEIFSISNFMEWNHLITYSDMFYKKKVVLEDTLDSMDETDIINFFGINDKLRQIHICSYKREDLDFLMNHIPARLLKNLIIYIDQKEENTELLMKEISYLRKIEKKYDIKIHIKYSKKYKEKNLLKQVNYQILKFILLIVIGIGIIYALTVNYQKGKEETKVEKITDTIDEIKKEEVITEEQEEKIDSYHTVYEKVFTKLLSLNKDTIGWLTVKGTDIDIPVVQSVDNDYYLNHSFDGTKSSFGWIYADYRNSFDTFSKNTILYGHNIRQTNLMFATLKNVLETSWLGNEDNHIITFSTTENDYKWEVFSVYTIDDTNDYLRTDFDDDDLYLRYLNQELGRSIYNFNVEVGVEDEILTLSTCYKDSSKRLVVHAKLIK